MDFIAVLGPAFVAHRLRRLSDQIVDDIARALVDLGLTVPSRSASTVLLLAHSGPLGPVDIARTLRLSHPLMVRALRALKDLGLVRAVDDPADQRRSRVELTPAGHAEAEKLAAFNCRLDTAMRDILTTQAGGADAFLASLDAISEALDQLPISARLTLKEDA